MVSTSPLSLRIVEAKRKGKEKSEVCIFDEDRKRSLMRKKRLAINVVFRAYAKDGAVSDIFQDYSSDENVRQVLLHLLKFTLKSIFGDLI